MRIKFSGLLSLCLLILLSSSAHATKNVEALVVKALAADSNVSAPAIAELRSLGPAGLEALVQAHQAEIRSQIANPTANDEWRRLTTALDAVSQQKDSYISQLYWYTDISEAKKAARATGKPILSLRLLGKLNEEFSCANSRFFRAVLYSNTEVSGALRDRFILHWQSVRAVPRITIDFGDGRKLERTITGNSIHYILDSDGHLIDGLPGLYGPGAFLSRLADAERIYQQLNGKSEKEREQLLWGFHRVRAGEISLNWYKDIARVGGKTPAGFSIITTANGEALQVMQLAVTKAVTEASLLRSIAPGAEALGRITDETAWTKIAALHSAEARLDQTSISLIKRQTQNVLAKETSEATVEQLQGRLLQQLQLNVALDTVRNEYLMHTTLHAWLVTDPTRKNVDAFNEKVYAQLFRTPRTDPWLGLFSAEVYTGLDNGGVVR